MQNYPSEGTSGWIPHDSQELPEQYPKRRRLRKRKRRPPMVSLTESSSEDYPSDRIIVRKRLRPMRLEPLREPWEELDDEIVRRPYVRRRVAPTYESPDDSSDEGYEKVNINPIGATLQFQEEEDTTRKYENEVISNSDVNQEENVVYGKSQNISPNLPEDTVREDAITRPTPDLKTLLKQNSGTLSLSEILQQKNLSLSELLTGNEKAISVLTEKPESLLEQDRQTDIKYRRLPPSIGLKKSTSRVFVQQEESTESFLSSKETLEAQRKRLALLNGFKENRVYSDVHKFDVITEPTTEKRIFVPSHPKYYTSLDYRPDMKSIDPVTEPYTTEYVTTTSTPFLPTMITHPSTTTQKLISRSTLKPKSKFGLPMTNSKIIKTTTKVIKEEENYPKISFTPKEINVNTVKGIFGNDEDETETIKVTKPIENTDGPFRMSLDLSVPINGGEIETTETEKPIVTSPQPEKLKHVTAKEEIMEILQDPLTRDKLSRILEIRNMTIEELVAQRERGSSQLHLADIFHNKTREPEPLENVFFGQINTNLDDITGFERKQKSMNSFDKPPIHNNPFVDTHITTNSRDNFNTQQHKKPQESYTVTSFPTYKIELNKSIKDSFQWPELYPSLFPKIYENNNKNPRPEVNVPSTTEQYDNNDGDIQRLEEIENKLSSLSNNRFNVDVEQQNRFGVEIDQNRYIEQEHEIEEPYFTLPTGVKSAILASIAIVGASLFVFVTILVIFKWSQKHKQRLNYCSSLSSKFRSPILDNEPKRTIKTFMNETLGKKKNNYYNYNKSHIQSMSDEIWDNDRKPY